MKIYNLIAPCGMNCALCMAYQREKNHCAGCRTDTQNMPISCRACIIRGCEYFKNTKEKYCSNKCEKFPCKRLKALDKRYRTKYNMSMLENLENVKKFGIKKFVENEKARWKCPNCGSLICVHRGCLKCKEELKMNN